MSIVLAKEDRRFVSTRKHASSQTSRTTHLCSTVMISFKDSCTNRSRSCLTATLSACGVLSSLFRFVPELPAVLLLSSGTGAGDTAAVPLVTGAGSAAAVAISKSGSRVFAINGDGCGCEEYGDARGTWVLLMDAHMAGCPLHPTSRQAILCDAVLGDFACCGMFCF
jgi:hypothetical protein